MKLLLVTYSFPPASSPRAYRWGAITDFWADRGHTIDVVCGSPGEADTKPTITTHRVRGLLRTVQAPRSVIRHSGSRYRPLLKEAREAARRVWRSFRWPDGAMSWVMPAAAHAASLARTHDYDALITSSYPFSSHVVGLIVRRCFDGLPWLVDIGDPFSFATDTSPNNFRRYDTLNQHAEGAVLRNASAITVTCEGARRAYVDRFPYVAARIAVVPPLTLVSPSTPHGHANTSTRRRPRLVYIGRLQRAIRSPEPLIQIVTALTARSNVSPELHFYGRTNDCAELLERAARQHPDTIFVHGEVPQETAHAVSSEADVLVNIDNDTPFQLPSKIVEYIASGRPILSIARNPDTDASRILRDWPTALHVNANRPTDPQQLVRLERFISEPPPAPSTEELEGFLRPYRIDSVATSYLAALERAAQPLHDVA